MVRVSYRLLSHSNREGNTVRYAGKNRKIKQDRVTYRGQQTRETGGKYALVPSSSKSCSNSVAASLSLVEKFRFRFLTILF